MAGISCYADFHTPFQTKWTVIKITLIQTKKTPRRLSLPVRQLKSYYEP